jgi:hypothetical protein
MRIQKNHKSKLAGSFYNGVQILQVFLIIKTRSSMFHRFPGKQKTEGIESPMTQSSVVFVSFSK